MRVSAWISAIFPEKKALPDKKPEPSRVLKDLATDWTNDEDVDGSPPEASGKNLFEKIEGFFSSLWHRVLVFFRIRSEASEKFSAHLQAQPNAPAPETVLRPITEPGGAYDKDEFIFIANEELIAVSEQQTQKLEQEPVDMEMLGSVPKAVAGTVGEPQVQAEDSKLSVGQIKFADYLHNQSESLDISKFFLDQDCIEYARGVVSRAASHQQHGRSLDSTEKAARSAAKILLESRSEHDRRIRAEEERLAKEAERKRESELLASKQPGQKDFEDFLVLFERHRSENTPLILVPGSRYLAQACIDYASLLPVDDINGEAVRFLELWARNPEASLAAMKAADHFMEPPPPRRLPPRVAVAVSEPEPLVTRQRMRELIDSFADLDDAGRAEMLAGTTLTAQSFDKAVRTLQSVVRNDGAAAGAPHPSSVEFKLNYARQASETIADRMEALQLAEYLLNHCKTRSDGFASMQGPKIQTLTIDGLLEEVRKERQTLQETRLAQRSQRPAKGRTNKVATAQTNAETRMVSAESIKLLTRLKGSIDGPGLMLAMYPNPQRAPNIPQIYEGALPYFESLIISGKVDDAAKANAQVLASLWQNAKRDHVQLGKMQALSGFAVLDAVFDPEKIDKDFA